MHFPRLTRALAAVAGLALAGCSAASAPSPSPTGSPTRSATASGAVQLALPCTKREVSIHLLGAQPTGQMVYLQSSLTDEGAAPCRLSGPLRFAAYLASGEPDRAASAEPDPGTPQSVDLTLDAAGSITLVFRGAARDKTGPCRQADEVTPKWLVVRIGSLAVRVRNHGDPGPDDLPSLYGCHGSVGIASLIRA